MGIVPLKDDAGVMMMVMMMRNDAPQHALLHTFKTI